LSGIGKGIPGAICVSVNSDRGGPLTPLDRRAGAALVERVTGGKTLPKEVTDEILARTDGVPLFIEELTKTVLESGLLQERNSHYVLERPLPSLAIPTTLQASLMARLDRLAPVREVAQIGPVAGREFHYELLYAADYSWPGERGGRPRPAKHTGPCGFVPETGRPATPAVQRIKTTPEINTSDKTE
jgi:hypothetical protein